MKVYLIPGVGADQRLFDRFELPQHEVVYLNWKPFGNARGMKEYAQVMASEINQNEAYAILGVSMGGMIAVEMAKILNPVHTILVSSSKDHTEFPPKIRITRATKVHYLGWGGLIKWFSLRAKKSLGVKAGGDYETMVAMMKGTDNRHFRKSIMAIMDWRNSEIPTNLTHIHGTADWILPHEHVKADYYIEGGTHVMIYDAGPEISTLVGEILESNRNGRSADRNIGSGLTGETI